MGADRKARNESMTDPASQRGPVATSRHNWMNRWMAILHTVGNVQAWILLSLFYVVILTPFGLVYRMCADPLRMRKSSASNWIPLPRQYDRLEQAKEQS